MKTTQIARLHNPTRAQLDRCIAANQPAILTGLLDDQAASKWDVPYLRSKLGPRTVQVVQQDKPRVYWDPRAGLPIKALTFNEFAESAFQRQDAGFSYLQDDVNSFPIIRQDYELPAMMADRGLWRAKFWLSGAGLVTPLHYDPVETFHWVIRGSKRFVCYKPGIGRYYPHPARSTAPFISRVDPDFPDPDKFPKFRRAQAVEFHVNDGEVLYLPTYWWHQVYSEGAVNISLNFIWFTSRLKALRHLPQALRAQRHIARGVAQVKAKENAARAEILAPQA